MMFTRVWLVGLLCLSLVAISGGKANAGLGGNADGDWGAFCPFPPFCTLDLFVDFKGSLKADQIFRGTYVITNGEVGCLNPTGKVVTPGDAAIRDVLLQAVGSARTDEKGKTQVGNTFFVTQAEWAAFCALPATADDIRDP